LRVDVSALGVIQAREPEPRIMRRELRDRLTILIDQPKRKTGKLTVVMAGRRRIRAFCA
jgi:hypothetical protein